MLGKKKTDAAATQEKPASKGKKAKSTRNVGGRPSPNFFKLHGEKLVFGALVGICGWLIYAGLSAPGFPTSKTPAKLRSDADQLMTQIRDESRWDAIAADRKVEHKFAEMALEVTKPTDAARYTPEDSFAWNPRQQSAFEKRGDPQIFAPEQVVVHQYLGPVAVQVPESTPDEYQSLTDAQPLESRTRGRRPRTENRNENEDGMTESTMPVTRILNAFYDLGASVANQAMQGEMAGGQPVRDGLGKNNRIAREKVTSRLSRLNVVTAVVPHKKLIEEFERVFRGTGSYDPQQRDTPFYLGFELQRADVTGSPNKALAEADWKTVSDTIQSINLPRRTNWAVKPPSGTPVPEVVDAQAIHPLLTMLIPPVLLDDYRQLVKHPAVSWAWSRDAVQSAGPVPGTVEQEVTSVSQLLTGLPMQNTGASMYGGEQDYDYATPGGYGGFSPDYGSASGYPTAGPPEYKMIRCVDVLGSGDANKVFRYRVRIQLQDPNYPIQPVADPAPNELADDVWQRVSELRRKEDSVAMLDRTKRTQRYSAWSEPSPPVRVASTFDFYAGPSSVEASKTYKLGEKVISVSAPDPEVQIAFTRFDGNGGARLALESTIRRGSVIGGKQDVDLIVPATKQIKVKPGVKIDTQAVAVDFLGGEPLAGSTRDDPLSAPLDVLVLQANGQIDVSNDIDDMFYYRRYTFADEREQAEKAAQQERRNQDQSREYGSSEAP